MLRGPARSKGPSPPRCGRGLAAAEGPLSRARTASPRVCSATCAKRESAAGPPFPATLPPLRPPLAPHLRAQASPSWGRCHLLFRRRAGLSRGVAWAGSGRFRVVGEASVGGASFGLALQGLGRDRRGLGLVGGAPGGALCLRSLARRGPSPAEDMLQTRAFGLLARLLPAALGPGLSRKACEGRGRAWLQPEGRDTGVQVYNSLTGRKDPLIVARADATSWCAGWAEGGAAGGQGPWSGRGGQVRWAALPAWELGTRSAGCLKGVRVGSCS